MKNLQNYVELTVNLEDDFCGKKKTHTTFRTLFFIIAKKAVIYMIRWFKGCWNEQYYSMTSHRGFSHTHCISVFTVCEQCSEQCSM